MKQSVCVGGEEDWNPLLFVKESLGHANKESAFEAEVWIQAARSSQEQSTVCLCSPDINLGKNHRTHPKTSAAWMPASLANSHIHSFTHLFSHR